MSVWTRETREEEAFQKLSPDRQANIEIVSSAYASMFADKAYLTMPITTGKRYYDVLDYYGVRSVEAKDWAMTVGGMILMKDIKVKLLDNVQITGISTPSSNQNAIHHPITGTYVDLCIPEVFIDNLDVHLLSSLKHELERMLNVHPSR